MNHTLFNKLHEGGLISDGSFNKIEQRKLNPLFSIHWEIKTLLFVGIALLTSGLGILVYKNIDTIGHQAILSFIGAVCIGCFIYCFKLKKPFSINKASPPNTFFDYILLLGSTSLLIFIGYLQYAYTVFGTHFGLATFLPMLALFYIAYDFDHIGILNMAIANFALWMGVSVTPKQLLANETFDSQTIIITYLCFGLILLFAAWLTGRYRFKSHFKFSYQHYGVHVSLIALLAGYFYNYDASIAVLWLFSLFVLAGLLFYDAIINKAFYFILLAVLYSYIAFTSLIIRGVIVMNDESALYLILIYFIFSAAGLVYLLIYLNKKIKAA